MRILFKSSQHNPRVRHHLRTLKSFLSILCLVVLVAQSSIVSAAGLSTGQQKLFKEGIDYFDLAPSCGTTASDGTTTIAPPTGKSAWNSNAQPPYYLEELII